MVKIVKEKERNKKSNEKKSNKREIIVLGRKQVRVVKERKVEYTKEGDETRRIKKENVGG